MLTQFTWCISVALCLEAQLVVSKTDPILRSLARRVPLAESEPNRQLVLPRWTTERWRNCRKIDSLRRPVGVTRVLALCRPCHKAPVACRTDSDRWSIWAFVDDVK
jgi:hypothetical protein